MNIFRKFIIFSALLASFGMCAFDAQMDPQHKHNLTRIAQVLDAVLVPEFGDLNLEHFHYAENITPAHFAHAKQFVFHKFPALKSKIVHAIKHELSQDQRALVIELLTSIKKISTTTTKDFETMANIAFSKELRKAQNKAMEMYCPPHIIQAIEQAQTRQEKIAAYKELEAVVLHNNGFAGELHDYAFNVPKNFMCACVYLDDVHLMTELLAAAHCSPSKHLFSLLISSIAVPYVAFNDLYYGPNLQEQLKNIGAIFSIVHTISSQLLEEVAEQQ